MKFKVGDKVRCLLKTDDPHYFASVETVKNVEEHEPYPIGVKNIGYAENELELATDSKLDSLEKTNSIIQGVGKDEPITVNESGGGQSRSHYRFDLADPKAMFEMCKVLDEGAKKYGDNNWRLISINDHLNHLLIHAYAYLAGDRSDEHLSHVMCRALFAQGVAVQTDEDKSKAVKKDAMG